MANPSGRKGHEGEKGIRDFINLRYPLADQGIGASIMTSGGSKDIGDIEGVPFTMVEAKNHKKPVYGSLMANAEIKFANSGRDFLLLSCKRPRFSIKRAGKWDALTTLGTLDRMGLLAEDGRNVFDLAQEEGVYPVTPAGFKHQHLSPKNLGCEVEMHVFSCYNGIGAKSHKVLDNTDLLAVCVFPRRGKPVEDWFAFTDLDRYMKLLEAIGVVPEIATNEE